MAAGQPIGCGISSMEVASMHPAERAARFGIHLVPCGGDPQLAHGARFGVGRRNFWPNPERLLGCHIGRHPASGKQAGAQKNELGTAINRPVSSAGRSRTSHA
jgi:hypothetical protein